MPVGNKNVVWIGLIAVSMVAFLGARLLPILDYREAHNAVRRNHLLSMVPQPLYDTTVSSNRGTTLSAFGYQYEVPWSSVEKRVQSGRISDVVFTSGEGVVFLGPRSGPRSGAAVEKFFRAEATQSNYQFRNTILNLTPQSFSLWMSSAEANRAITLFSDEGSLYDGCGNWIVLDSDAALSGIPERGSEEDADN